MLYCANTEPEVKLPNPRWRPPPCRFCKNHYNSANYAPILIKFDTRIHGNMLYWANAKSEVNFQNPRWRPPLCQFNKNHYHTAKYGPISVKFDRQVHKACTIGPTLNRNQKVKIQDGVRRHVNFTWITITRPNMDRFSSNLTDRIPTTCPIGCIQNQNHELKIQDGDLHRANIT